MIQKDISYSTLQTIFLLSNFRLWFGRTGAEIINASKTFGKSLFEYAPYNARNNSSCASAALLKPNLFLDVKLLRIYVFLKQYISRKKVEPAVTLCRSLLAFIMTHKKRQ